MSYDIWITPNASGVGIDWNRTSGYAPVWRLAMPDTDGLAGLHGMRARAAADVITRGITRILHHPEAFTGTAYSWLDLQEVVAHLAELVLAFRQSDPDDTVSVFR